jgi:hypothetical protein
MDPKVAPDSLFASDRNLKNLDGRIILYPEPSVTNIQTLMSVFIFSNVCAVRPTDLVEIPVDIAEFVMFHRRDRTGHKIV